MEPESNSDSNAKDEMLQRMERRRERKRKSGDRPRKQIPVLTYFGARVLPLSSNAPYWGRVFLWGVILGLPMLAVALAIFFMDML